MNLQDEPINRSFDYSQRVLVAVEVGVEPHRPAGLPDTHAVFRRIPIAEVAEAFGRQVPLIARLILGKKFRRVLDQRMGYWESRVPVGQSCFVHYVRGNAEAMEKARIAFSAASNAWVLLGVYHIEPQSSAYPFGFPFNPVPDHWFHGRKRDYTPDSLFWFNFFPDQKFLFEKTFVVWALFSLFRSKEGGACNQLVAADDPARLTARGVEPFVQINLNRFTSYEGYFTSARAAGKHTFTQDKEYIWYGMLLRKFAL
jgi:hypothetical protein